MGDYTKEAIAKARESLKKDIATTPPFWPAPENCAGHKRRRSKSCGSGCGANNYTALSFGGSTRWAASFLISTATGMAWWWTHR